MKDSRTHRLNGLSDALIHVCICVFVCRSVHMFVCLFLLFIGVSVHVCLYLCICLCDKSGGGRARQGGPLHLIMIGKRKGKTGLGWMQHQRIQQMGLQLISEEHHP